MKYIHILYLIFSILCGLLVTSVWGSGANGGGYSPQYQGQCVTDFGGYFTHGVNINDDKGEVKFEQESQIWIYLSSEHSNYYPWFDEIEAPKTNDKTSGYYNQSCGNSQCDPSGDNTPELDLGGFQDTESNTKYDITTSVSLPAGDYGNINVKQHGQLTFTGSGGVYRMKTVNLEQGTDLYLPGGVYFIEKLNVKYQAKIHHVGSEPVLLYVEKEINFEQEAQVNRYGDPSKFLIYGEKHVNLKYRSQTRAFFYVKGKIKLEQSSRVKGAVNAADIHMKYDSLIMYDQERVGDISVCTGEEPEPETELVGHWKSNVCSLDGSNGEVVDVIAGNNGRSVDGASIEVDGKFCQALRFNGDDANVLIPHDDDFALDDGSISFWFKASDLNHSSDRGQGGQGLWSKDSSGWNAGGDHLTIWLNRNGSLRARHQVVNDRRQDINLYSSPGSVSANQWYHLVYTWGSNGSYMYLNGNEVDDNPAVRSLAGNPEPIVIGANAWTTEDYGSSSQNLKDKLKGEIDDIRLYSGQLGANDVIAIRDEENPDDCDECEVQEPELIAQYNADACDINGDGGSYVDSINGYNGVYVDGVETDSGKYCNAVSFNGDDEHVNIPHNNDFGIAEGAIAMWINVPDLNYTNIDDSIHDGQAIFSKDSSGTDNGGKHLTVWVNDNGSIRVRHQTSGENEIQSSGGLINENQWHHIMYTWGGDGKRLYIDGQLRDSDNSPSQGIESNPEPIIVGANASTTGNSVSEPSKLDNWFNGRIDDLRIYGEAQPDDDFVQSVFNDEVDCEDCMVAIAHYRFEGSFDTAFDSETGNYDGNPFPETDSGLELIGCTTSTLGSGQALSIPRNDSASIRQAMDAGIEPEDIGPKGTISFWYRANESWVNGRDRQLFDGSDSSKYFHGTILDDGRVMFGLEDKNDGDARVFTQNSFNYSAGTWVHLAFTWDISNTSVADMKIFINGIEQSVDKPIDTLNSTEFRYSSTIFFGDNSHPTYLVGGSSGNSADGQFDDVRIYGVDQSSSNLMTDMSDLAPCDFEVNRYRLEFPSSVAACGATDITVKACEDLNCTNLATGVQQVWVDFEDADGDTTSVVDGLTLNNGIAAISNWKPERSGVGTFLITGNTPNPENSYTCNQPNCQITYNDAEVELVYIVNGQESAEIPVEIGEQAFSQTNGSLVARTPASCKLPESQPLEIAVECVDPAICSGNTLDIIGNGGSVTSVSPVNQLGNNVAMPDSSFVTYHSAFDGTEISLDNLVFNDAGEIKIHLRVAGQTVTHNVYVIPQYLELSSDIHPATPDLETVNTAGNNFNMTVTAIGANGGVLPGYTPGELEFSLERITPENVNGASTSLFIINSADSNEVITVSDSSTITQFDGNGFNTQPTFANGISAPLVAYMPEVGRFAVDVQDTNYLGKGQEVGLIRSILIFNDVRDSQNELDLNYFVFSRFIPEKFTLSATIDYAPYCGVFTFRGDTIEASADGAPHSLIFTAVNSRGETTAYYDAETQASGSVSESSFINGQPIVSEYLGTDSGKQSTGLRLTSMGRYTSGASVEYTVWRIRNSADNTQSVVLTAYNNPWETSFQIAANSEYFLASPVSGGSATHQLFLGNTNLDTKAAGSQTYNIPTGSTGSVTYERGGSFKFALGNEMFASRFYTGVSLENGQNGLTSSTYPYVSFTQEDTLFINDVLADGVFEYRFEADNVLFDKYFGRDTNGDELAKEPIINGDSAGEVSVRFNLDTDLLSDSDGVSVDLNEVVETTGKSLYTSDVNGSQILIVDNLLDAFEVRSGRIRLVNSVSATQAAEVGIVSEYYAGDNKWETNGLDSCNTYHHENLAVAYVQNSITGSPELGFNTEEASVGNFENGIGDGADGMSVSIEGFAGESATGLVVLGYNIPAELFFLQYRWCDANNHVISADDASQSASTEDISCLNPIAEYTFGLERGNDRVMNWREVLR